jgi:hypothetical protein
MHTCKSFPVSFCNFYWILDNVLESLIIHKSYSTSLMIHIVSCVPAFMGFSWKDLPS